MTTGVASNTEESSEISDRQTSVSGGPGGLRYIARQPNNTATDPEPDNEMNEAIQVEGWLAKQDFHLGPAHDFSLRMQ